MLLVPMSLIGKRNSTQGLKPKMLPGITLKQTCLQSFSSNKTWTFRSYSCILFRCFVCFLRRCSFLFIEFGSWRKSKCILRTLIFTWKTTNSWEIKLRTFSLEGIWTPWWPHFAPKFSSIIQLFRHRTKQKLCEYFFNFVGDNGVFETF